MSDSHDGISINYSQVDNVCSELQGVISFLQAENEKLERELFNAQIPVYNPVTHYYETNDSLIAALSAEI